MHIYIYIHIHIYTYIHIYIYTYTCIYMYIYTYTHIYIYAYTHIYVYVYIYIYTQVYIQMGIHTPYSQRVDRPSHQLHAAVSRSREQNHRSVRPYTVGRATQSRNSDTKSHQISVQRANQRTQYSRSHDLQDIMRQKGISSYVRRCHALLGSTQ